MTRYADHEIEDRSLSIVMDEAHDGTWTASWWFPIPTEGVDWADGTGSAYTTPEAAEQAAIDWARKNGPQKRLWHGVVYLDRAAR